MSGSLSIPNTFATASGSVAASLLDADFTAVANYVNTREITLGLLGSRPAAGVAGRFYFATDTGLMYADTGSAWTTVSQTSVGVSTGAPRVAGLTGVNNTGTPNTKYDLSADFVQMRNPTDGAVKVVASPGTLTNDVGAAASANGRDQAGAFSASSFIYFYFISDGTTTATLSSATPPPTGPTLPGVYTHWAYAGAVRFNGSSQLVATHMRDRWTHYDSAVQLIADGRATVEATVSAAAAVPANAARYNLLTQAVIGSTNAWKLRVITGVNYYAPAWAGSVAVHSAMITVPNVSQQVFYVFGADPGSTAGFYANVIAYENAD